MTPEERIRRLEGRTRILTALLVITPFICLLMGQAQASPDSMTVKAQRFVVLDEAGKERATLGMQGKLVRLDMFTHYDPPKRPAISFGTEAVESAPMAEYGRMIIRGLTIASTITVTGDGVTIHNSKDDQSLSMEYVNSPIIGFTDKSGMKYMTFSYNDKDGPRLEMRHPLGIEGASDEVAKSSLQDKPLDNRIHSAYYKTLRFEVAAPPFGDPFIRVWKDGEVLSKIP